MMSEKQLKEWMAKTRKEQVPMEQARAEHMPRGPVTMRDVYLEEARQKDAEFRRRQVANMAEGQSREALLTLLGVLADQMPPMTAEAGYWYTLGFLEATVGTYKGAGEDSDKQEGGHV